MRGPRLLGAHLPLKEIVGAPARTFAFNRVAVLVVQKWLGLGSSALCLSVSSFGRPSILVLHFFLRFHGIAKQID